MAESSTVLYEGLFLLNQGAAASDFGGCVKFLGDVLERAEAEVITLNKWDERKLAYPVQNQKRGTFMLAVFRVRGTQIANIERDCNLSDQVMRCMILRADHLGEAEIELLKKDADDLKVEENLRSEGKSEQGASEESDDKSSDSAAPTEKTDEKAAAADTADATN